MVAGKKEMMAEYRAKKSARKKRQKWWREHIVLAYVVSAALIVSIYLTIDLIFEKTPKWLAMLGVTPSGISLITGTLFCAIAASGLRRWRELKGGWLFLYVLCGLQGCVALARALSLL